MNFGFFVLKSQIMPPRFAGRYRKVSVVLLNLHPFWVQSAPVRGVIRTDNIYNPQSADLYPDAPWVRWLLLVAARLWFGALVGGF